MVKKAFTLIELTIVIFIFALLSYFTWQSFARFNNSLLVKGQAEEIISVLENARAEAESRNEKVEVIFNYDSYRLETDNNVLKVYKLKPDFTAEEGVLSFAATGNPAEAGTIYLNYQGRKAAKIILAVASGILRWEKI